MKTLVGYLAQGFLLLALHLAGFRQKNHVTIESNFLTLDHSKDLQRGR